MIIESWMPYAVTGDLENIDPITMEELRREWSQLPAYRAFPFKAWLREHVAEVLECIIEENEARFDENQLDLLENETTTDAHSFGFDIVAEANRTLGSSLGIQRW